MWNFLAGLWLGAALSAGDDEPRNNRGNEPGGCAEGCVLTIIFLIVIVLCCCAVASCIDTVG